MKQEDRELLLKDLSARLPYGVVCVGITYELDDDGERYIPVKVKDTLTLIDNYNLETASVKLDLTSSCKLETVKPYLRPMSSMTEEEEKEYNSLNAYEGGFFPHTEEAFDWLNAHHFDYRGLIPKGLALEAPNGIYN